MNYGGNANHIMDLGAGQATFDVETPRRVFVIIIFSPKQKTVS